jgi:D-tyrosyl-tRNA(Tyr) deacylase
MRALIQRVRSGRVKVGDEVVGEIGPGILTFLGVGQLDSKTEAEWLIRKILSLRIFEDEKGKMNRSLLEIQAEHLIVSQFTLYADCSQGNRPGFSAAARPDHAQSLYQHAIQLSQSAGIRTATGRFQAEMHIELINDGPVTFFLETPLPSTEKDRR